MEDNGNWGEERFRKPTLPEKAREIFSECGRVIRHEGANWGVDYRSHWLVLFKYDIGGYCLRVKHGGGEETFDLGHSAEPLIKAFEGLSSDDRYEALYIVYKAASTAAQTASEETRVRYARAFLDKRLKRRRSQNKIYVDVLPEIVSIQA